MGVSGPARAIDQSVAVFGGVSSKSRYLYNYCCPWLIRPEADFFAGIAYQRQLARLPLGFSVGVELGAGSHFGMATSPQIWAGGYLRYNGFPWDHYLRTTISYTVGVNYATTVPAAEQRIAVETGTPTSNLFFYLAPEISFSLPAQPNVAMFFRVHHRSGLYPRISKSAGASNVVAAGIRWTY